jgi:hypothetical protein
MAFDASVLSRAYEVRKLSVISSTQISSRTAAVLSALDKDVPAGEKPVVVCLTAQSRVASKLISIVEIVKRELLSKQVHYFQYNALTSQMTEIPRQTKKTNGHAAAGATSENDDDDDNAFQTMGVDAGMKRRVVPVMQVYLSKVAIKELRSEFG